MGMQVAGLGRRPQALRHCLYRHIEHRRQQQAEERHAEHTAEHGCAEQSAVISAPAPVSDYQRKHAQDEGERGHQNGPQADLGWPRR